MKTADARHTTKMMKAQYLLRFNTPAFLGNAENSAQWRTPPFKHLLREWWRVAWAERRNFSADVNAMRQEEGKIFGAASDGAGSKSRLRLRLDRWDVGKMTHWPNDPGVTHPEVKGGKKIGSHLYLGYGPLNFNHGTFLGKKSGREFKANAAIQAAEEAELKLAFPEADAALLDRALTLMHQYGTLGGRSRNGWGSLELRPSPSGKEAGGEGHPPLREWRECLDREWAQAIGKDENGALIWRTGPFGDWRQLMGALAEIKIGLRTQFKFHSGRNAPRPEARHWLSYPVTNHSVSTWGNNARLPNTLRFKVRRDDHGKLYGVIFHLPCKPPREFRPNTQTLETVWRNVHRFLDANPNLQRSPQ